MKRSSKLLFDSPPVIIQREAAQAFGDRMAMLLQQVHYYALAAEKTQNKRWFADGEYWAVFTYAEWNAQLSWLSLSTIQRLITKAEAEGLVFTRLENGQAGKHSERQVKWLRINYDELEKRELTPEQERYTGDF